MNVFTTRLSITTGTVCQAYSGASVLGRAFRACAVRHVEGGVWPGPLASSLWLIHNRTGRSLHRRDLIAIGVSPDIDGILNGFLTCGSYIKLQTTEN
jgi:hypothetical protein